MPEVLGHSVFKVNACLRYAVPVSPDKSKLTMWCMVRMPVFALREAGDLSSWGQSIGNTRRCYWPPIKTLDTNAQVSFPDWQHSACVVTHYWWENSCVSMWLLWEGHLEVPSDFSWTSSDVLFPFVNFNLYDFSVTNINDKCHSFHESCEPF